MIFMDLQCFLSERINSGSAGQVLVQLSCVVKIKMSFPLFSGSAITGPVAKECADLWPRIASNASSIC